jgi:CubicO group peptidase (beta-lactamase class C family)
VEIHALPAELAAYAEEECKRLSVPGAAVGVLHDHAIYVAGVGVTSVEDPLPVTPQTLFQIGSTSKTFTATAAMQLVEEGRLDLDMRVRDYLPDFRLQSEQDAARLTVRDLVTHHTGYVGDYFRDTGRGDDAIAKIVAKMANSRQLVPAGTTFSYSNAGFYVLGRIVEVLREEPFEQVIRERIFAPLEMTHSFYFAEECIAYPTAMKHIVTRDGPKVARPWNVPRSIAPGGGITSNVIDQLRYAALHVGSDESSNVLPRRALEYMQAVQRPAGSMCEWIGVSWMLDDAGDGQSLAKHGGSTTGHESSFELIPARGFAVTVLTNADTGRAARQTIADRCQRCFLGFDKPEPKLASHVRVAPTEYAGRYEATLETLEVSVVGEGLSIVGRRPERASAAPRPVPIPVPAARLAFTDDDRTVVLDGARRGERVEFLRDDRGRIEWLRWDGRLARRL